MCIIKNMIQEIENGIENKANIEYFEKIYEKNWDRVRWNVMTIENDVFYRARISEKTRLFSNVNELKYPSASLVKQCGRLNDIGESIAYLSTGSITPLVELDIDYYQIICMTEVKYILKDIMFFIIGIKGEYEGITQYESDFINFFNHLFTTPNKNYYNATIAFSHKIFKSGLININNRKKSKVGIAYNSAQESKTNKYLHNFAVEPHVFDECFDIKKATYQLMKYRKKEDAIEIVNINEGEISQEGTIKWQRDFKQMIDYCNNLFRKDIFSIYDPNGEKCIIKYPEGSGKIKKQDKDSYYVDFKNYGLTKVEKLSID